MVAPAQKAVERFISEPPTAINGFLFYGPDAAQIEARSSRLATVIANRYNPTADIFRLNETDLTLDPPRVSIELETSALFGGRKVIWLTALPIKVHALLTEAVERTPLQADLIVQAPGLKKNHKLVQLFETAKHLAAIVCYGEEEADLPNLITQFARDLGYTLSKDAATLIASRANFSGMLARSEVEKLVAFAGPCKTITLEDVELCLVDQSTAEAYDIADAALLGQEKAVLFAFHRFTATEDSVVPVLAALSSSLQRLSMLRSAVESGKTAEAAISAYRPPIFFKQQAKIASQLKAWTVAMLENTLSWLNECTAETRLKPHLAEAITAQLLLDVARKSWPPR